MAQSMRRSNTLGTMDHKLQRDKSRTGYFGNARNRLGSKLSASGSQPQELSKSPLEPEPRARCGPLEPEPRARCGTTKAKAGGGHPLHVVASGPVHHIRNPKLRQYYLQGAESSPQLQGVQPSPARGSRLQGVQPSPARGSRLQGVQPSPARGSRLQGVQPSPARGSRLQGVQPSPARGSRLQGVKLRVSKGKKGAAVPASSLGELKLSGADPRPKLQPEVNLPVNAASASPEAEYDKLLDVEAVPMPDGQLCLLTLPPECCQGEGPEAVPYLKLFCRYITDGKGVVSGVLLVTSHKLFFDPCKSPVVLEHGCEEYLLSMSLDHLASVTLFSDITHVHFSQSQHRWKGRRSTLRTPPPRVRHDSLNPTKQEVEAGGAGGPSPAGPSGPPPVPPSGEDDGAADVSEAEKHLESGDPPKTLSEGAALNSAAPSWCGGLDASRKALEPSGQTKPKEEESCLRKRPAAAPGSRGPSGPGGVMFVRLRALEKTPGPQQGASSTVPRGDTWLALSQESSDQLHAYLSRWRPEMSILDGGAEDRDGEAYEEEFVLIEDDEEEHKVAKSDRHSGEDWEMLSIENEWSLSTLLIDRDPECLTDILEASCILEASHVRELCTELPPRTIGHAWQLTYSTSCHGFSLQSLYRRLRASDSPVLIVIKDALDQVFGSFLSHPLRPSETFYGTGETFLFMLHPRFKCFRWTGENTFFIKGNLDSFAIGGGSGHFGLWLDETLYLGRSSPCYTFNNCCLSEVDDFHVIAMEVWTFS
ncbi:unnamed protein product [Lota lota]